MYNHKKCHDKQLTRTTSSSGTCCRIVCRVLSPVTIRNSFSLFSLMEPNDLYLLIGFIRWCTRLGITDAGTSTWPGSLSIFSLNLNKHTHIEYRYKSHTTVHMLCLCKSKKNKKWNMSVCKCPFGHRFGQIDYNLTAIYNYWFIVIYCRWLYM